MTDRCRVVTNVFAPGYVENKLKPLHCGAPLTGSITLTTYRDRTDRRFDESRTVRYCGSCLFDTILRRPDATDLRVLRAE